MNLKTFFSMFFGILLTISTAIAQEAVNQLDSEGKRHGVWKKYFPGSKQLRYEGQFEHGQEVGIFKFYCEDCKDQPMVVKDFNNEGNVAEVKYYTAKGKLVSQGLMNGKERVGEWLYFQEKSKDVMTREMYVEGKLHGDKITYYLNGKVTEEMHYENGSIEGPNNYYSPDGVLLKELLFENNELHGPATYYDANGAISIKGQYKRGKKDGIWKYYKGGKFDREETFPKPLKKGI